MDVQGSRFHLLFGYDDWARCLDGSGPATLGQAWAAAGEPGPGPGHSSAWEYDADRGLRLRRDTPLFRRAGRRTRLDLGGRRGAARDRYGAWYWIDEDRRGIRRRGPAGTPGASVTWWSGAGLGRACAGVGDPADVLLDGLAITVADRLITGYRLDPGTARERTGLLVFDLEAGGAPLRLAWPCGPGGEPLLVTDLADSPDGGVLVLDATARRYYRLDAHLRVTGDRPIHRPAFGTPGPLTLPTRPVGVPVDLAEPVSIEPGPDRSVLILGSDPVAGHSVLRRYDGADVTWERPLRDCVEVIDPDDPEARTRWYSILAHDMCHVPNTLSESPGDAATSSTLYVADAEGDQVVAFALDAGTGAVRARDDFLPMRRWAARALVRADGRVWYDIADRFVPLVVFTQCRFASAATLTAPLFDGRDPGCVWHRVLIDAVVPAGATLTVRARADDDPDLLAAHDWVRQPTPYRRGDGCELPWFDPWAHDPGRPGDAAGSADFGGSADAAGTYEVLLQGITGRHAQLSLSVEGDGRSTPLIRSVRAWYPRFSYVTHYLPDVYAEHDPPARFLERFLANPEGVFTAIEERIEHSHLLLDARTAPAADLPWLAAFFGLALDPLWDEPRRRYLIRHVDRFYRRRGTIAGLLDLLRLYLNDDTTGPVCATSAPGRRGVAGRVRIVERFLLRDIGADAAEPGDGDARRRAAGSAHRFDVLVSGELPDDRLAMVRRIVGLGRPAHTLVEVRGYDEAFAVGRARLGQDTELGQAPRFATAVLGRDRLATLTLGAAHPADVADRIVLNRDRFGALPPL